MGRVGSSQFFSQESQGGRAIMFERYTEKARRVIFFARYEASQFGSPYIETEHLLARTSARRQGPDQSLPALARLGRIDPQADRRTHHDPREGFDLRRPAAEQRVQARAGLRRGRSRAPVAQAHRHRTSAVGPAARRKMLCRGNSARARPAAFAPFAKNWRAQRRRKAQPQRQRRDLRCWREFSPRPDAGRHGQPARSAGRAARAKSSASSRFSAAAPRTIRC